MRGVERVRDRCLRRELHRCDHRRTTRREEVRGADAARGLGLRAVDDADIVDDEETSDRDGRRERPGGVGDGGTEGDTAIARSRGASSDDPLAIEDRCARHEPGSRERDHIPIRETGVRCDGQHPRLAVRRVADVERRAVRIHTDLGRRGSDVQRHSARAVSCRRNEGRLRVPSFSRGQAGVGAAQPVGRRSDAA